MSGSNGHSPVVNLASRQRCATAPTKRRYPTSDEAKAAAEVSSAQSGLKIVAYLCTSCGQYHLTKSVGGDSYTLPEGKFTIGGFHTPKHPVFSGQKPAEEPPIVPGDFDTRLRAVREYLGEFPEPTTTELCEMLGGCTKNSLRQVMAALGYHNTRGRFARWVPDTRPEPTPEPPAPADEAPAAPPVDLTPRRRRRVVDPARIGHIALADLIESYRACGLRLVLTLEDDDS